MYTFKISVVGCGSVGATTAYALLLKGIPTHLALIDIQKEKAEGLILDMEHSLPFTPAVSLSASGDFAACRDSDLIIITAGKRSAPGETRLDLAEANKKIFQSIIPKITEAAPDALLLIVTNPVDVLTYEAIRLCPRLPQGRIFGTGTILDTARFQFHISEKIKVHPRSIDAYILGEHGNSSFPVWSSANVLGKPLKTFEGFTEKIANECYEVAKNAAERIIHDVGYTCYSIATATAEIAENIKENSRHVFPLSVLLKNYYGHSDVVLSVPCVLGKDGIENILEIPLNEEEQKKLAQCVALLKKF